MRIKKRSHLYKEILADIKKMKKKHSDGTVCLYTDKQVIEYLNMFEKTLSSAIEYMELQEKQLRKG